MSTKFATLKSFLTWAAAAGIAPGLPVPAQGGPGVAPSCPAGTARAAVARSPRAERPAPRRRTPGKPRDLAVVRLLLNTGLRFQELCELTWKDAAVSDRKGLLTVRHGKGGKHRQVPLNHDARAALTALGYPQRAGEGAVILRGSGR